MSAASRTHRMVRYDFSLGDKVMVLIPVLLLEVLEELFHFIPVVLVVPGEQPTELAIHEMAQ